MGHAVPTDQKGSILDTEIKIKPSKILWEFIKSMNIVEDMPKNLTAIIMEKGPVKNYGSQERKKVILTKQDLTIIKSIISENLPIKDESADPNIATEAEESPSTMLKMPKNKVNKVNKKKSENLLKSTENVESSELQKGNVAEESNVDSSYYLNTADLEWLYNYLNTLRRQGNSVQYLHELVQDSELVLPQNEIIKRNAQLEARCKKLRSQQDARDYRAMTKSVDNVRKMYPEDTIAYQMKHMNRQLISIGQFIISVAAGFLFGFLGVELMVGNLDFGFRLLLGVMCALIIALAEIYFLAKQLNEEMSLPETTQIGGPAKFQDDDNKKPHQD